jgi:hypothetical protein
LIDTCVSIVGVGAGFVRTLRVAHLLTCREATWLTEGLKLTVGQLATGAPALCARSCRRSVALSDLGFEFSIWDLDRPAIPSLTCGFGATAGAVVEQTNPPN